MVCFLHNHKINKSLQSLLSTLANCVQNNEQLPRVKLMARQLEIEQKEPTPLLQQASNKSSFAWPNVRELCQYFSHLKIMDSATSLGRRLRPRRSVYVIDVCFVFCFCFYIFNIVLTLMFSRFDRPYTHLTF